MKTKFRPHTTYSFKTMSLWVVGFSLIGVTALLLTQAATPPKKIMVIGDSITADNPAHLSGSNGGWRRPLYNSLVSAGYSNFEFVGSQNLDGASGQPIPAALKGHEGYGGWTTCDFFSDIPAARVSFRTQAATGGNQGQPLTWQITNSLSTYNPDVVIVAIGTNNLINEFLSSTDCPPNKANLERLYNVAVNAPSNPTVVISTLDVKESAAQSPAAKAIAVSMNNITRSYVQAQAALGKKVCLAELEGVYTGAYFFQDAYHPNQAGKDVIAAAYLPPTRRALDGQCPSTVVDPKPADTVKPVVAITAPLAGTTVSAAAAMAATASDNVAVTKVEFYVDGALLGSDTTSPYNYIFDTTTYTNGDHNLTVKAYDAAGNIGTNAVVMRINNSTTPPPTPKKCDFNNDTKVDSNDLFILLANFNKTVMANTKGDCNGTGKVDTNDLFILLAVYGK